MYEAIYRRATKCVRPGGTKTRPHRRRLRETEGPRSQTSAAARALTREFEPTGRSFRDSLGFLRKIGQQIQERSVCVLLWVTADAGGWL